MQVSVMNWGNNDVSNVQFLAQTNRFSSKVLNISARATGINFMLLEYTFLTLKVMATVDFL